MNRAARLSGAFGLLLSTGLMLQLDCAGLGSAQSLPRVPAVADIVTTFKQQWDGVKSLFVEYELTAEAVGGAANVKRYLGSQYLARETVTFAFKANKRYYRLRTPPSAPRLAPGVDLDYDAIPGGEQMKKVREQTKAQMIAMLGEEKAREMLSSSEPFRLDGHFEVAFDGTALRRRNPGGLFAVHRIDNLDVDDTWLKQDYLYRVCHALADPIKPDNRHAMGRLEEFLVSAHYAVQAATEDVEGTPCVVVTGGERLWLDPRLGYAVRKREAKHRGTDLLAERYVNRDFVEVLPGTWLPRTLEWERFGPPRAPVGVRGHPLLRYTYKVTRLSANDVPDSLFKLEPKPGSIVWDGTVLPKKGGEDLYIDYIMPANPEQVDEAIKAAIGDVESGEFHEQLRRRLRWGSVAVLITACAVTVLWWYNRRKRLLWRQRA